MNRGSNGRYGFIPPGLRWTNPLEVLSVGLPALGGPGEPARIPGVIRVVVEVADLGGPNPPLTTDATRNQLVKLLLAAGPKSAALVIASLMVDAERGGMGDELAERAAQVYARMRDTPPAAWEHYGQAVPSPRPPGGGF